MSKTETKNGNKKIIFIIVVAVLAIAAAVVMIIFMRKKEETFRLLKIFEVEGKANVNRKGIGDIAPYVNMVLESEDRISLDTGNLTILADDDKYIFLENNTEIVLKASGDSTNSKTEIELTKGAITNNIENKLSDDSSYEINTPNSTMSVRGTIYRVWIYEIDGVKYTRVTVYDGVVVTRLVYKDGTVDDREVQVNAGKEVIIYEDATTTNYLSDPTDIDFDSLPEEALLLLMDFNDEGEEVCITNTEILRILEGPYEVTFKYNGKVFGTQTVKKGEKAEVPSLSPEASGSWNFNFDTPINRDTVIEWK